MARPRRTTERSRARDRRRSGAFTAAAILVVLVALGASYWAVRRSESAAGSSGPAAGAAARGGTYTEGDVGAPGTLNPLLARSQTEQDLARILFRGLTSVDGSGTPRPELAERWSVSDDGRAYAFTLRPDARWHDGKPVTAEDVVFTIALIQDPDFPGDPTLARFWRGVTVTATDERTVTFHLLEPFAAFPNYASVPILPKHALGGVLARDLPGDPFSREPIGSGPFRFAGFDDGGATLTLEAVPDFYGGRPYLDRVVFRFYRDGEAALAALRRHAVDGVGAIPPSEVMRPGSLPRDATVYGSEVTGFTALFFDLRNQLFASADVRKALALAIDRRAIARDALKGQVEPGASPIPQNSWAYLAQDVPSADLAEARRLLGQAGWQDHDGDGVLDNGSLRLSFPLLVNADDLQRVRAAQEIASQLRVLGVEATVQPASSADVAKALAARQFTAAVFGWHSATGDPDCFELWHSSRAEDGLNFSGLRDETIDSLLSDARRTPDPERRKALYAEFQQVFAEQVPAVVLYYPRYFFAVRAKVHGVQAAPIIEPSDRLADLAHWYIATASPSPTP